MSVPSHFADGRYEIQELLGQGGFGSSFRALDTVSGQLVAIKVAGSANEDVADRLQAEARVLARISHGSIATVIDSGALEDGRPYIVLDWVEGRSLAQILKNGPLGVGQALDVSMAVARALVAVHGAGVIHRDLKPSNVIIPLNGEGQAERFDRATLIDFGVFGELVREGREEVTQAGQFFGTPYSMAPEQLRGEPQTVVTDVYGLGVLLFEMLFGTRPFEGDSITQVIVQILQAPVEIPERVDVSGELAALVASCLEKDAKLRPQSAAEFLSLVRRQVPAEAVPAVAPAPPGREPTGAFEVACAPERSSAPVARKLQAPGQRTRKTGPVFMVLFAVAMTLAAIAAVAIVTLVGSPAFDVRSLWGIGGGVALVAGGLSFRSVLSRFVRRRSADVGKDAGELLLGTKSRDSLSRSLAIEVEQLLERCSAIDERILGLSIAKMIDEYQAASESEKRQTALMNVAELLEKLMRRLSPWYVRYEKALALGVSFLTVASGIASVIVTIFKS